MTISVDTSEVQKALSGTKKSIKSIQSGALRIIARGTIKAIKTDIRLKLNKRTGELLKCYTYKLKKNGSEINIFPKGKNSKIFPKVYTLNYGLNNTNHKPYSFIESGEKYAEGNSYQAALEKYVEKELKKYWG